MAHVVALRIRALGIEAKDRLDLAALVSRGISARAVRHFEAATGLPRNAIFAAARIPQRTAARQFKEGRFKEHESERLARLARVVDLAEDLLGDRSEAVAWLQKGNPDLRGATPLAVAGSDLGVKEVEALIGRLEHGVYL